MSGYAVTVQACGRIAVPEVEATLRMGPGVGLALRLDAAERPIHVQVTSSSAETAAFVESSACPLIEPT